MLKHVYLENNLGDPLMSAARNPVTGSGGGLPWTCSPTILYQRQRCPIFKLFKFEKEYNTSEKIVCETSEIVSYLKMLIYEFIFVANVWW